MVSNILAGGIAAFAAALPFSIAVSSLIIFPLLALWLFGTQSRFHLERPVFGEVEMAFGIFLLVSLLSAFMGINPRHSFHEIYKKDLYFVILVFATSILKHRPHRERAIRFFITAILLSAALGPLQFIISHSPIEFRNSLLVSPIGDVARAWPRALSILGLAGERATGTLPHWLHYAESLLFGLALCVSSLIMSATRAWWKWLLAGWLIVLGLLASLSRGPWLAAVAMVFVSWIAAPSRQSVARSAMTLLPALVILFVPVLSSRVGTIGDMTHQSNAERLHMWQVGAVLWQSHPLLGIGPGNVKAAALPFEYELERSEGGWGHLHSIYVNFAAERGTVGLAAFFGLMGSLAFELLRGFRRSPILEDKRLLWSALLALLGFLLSGLTEATYNTATVLMTLYFLTGAARAAMQAPLVESRRQMS